MTGSKSSFQRRYPPEMRERAVRMVHEAIAESGESVGAVTRVARQLGIGPESQRNWVKQADIDHGKHGRNRQDADHGARRRASDPMIGQRGRPPARPSPLDQDGAGFNVYQSLL
jgi:transposase-like protein